MKQLISVDDAVAMVLKDTAALPGEKWRRLHEAAWPRAGAEPSRRCAPSRLSLPSAMDGYAVRAADAAHGAELAVIGESRGRARI